VTLDTPVLIAGGGPVGLTLAMDLAWRGVKSIVLESRLDLPPNPRCNTTNARSMEVFRRLGCADAIRAAGLPADHCTDVVYMTTMNGAEFTRYRRPTPQEWREGRPVGIGSDWPTPEPQHFISQLYMEPPLRAHAVQQHGVDLRLGVELGSFTQDDRGVSAEVRDAQTGASGVIRAAYLVGADGSNSRVRRDIGARLEGIPKIADSVTLFIRAPRLTELWREHPGWMYRFLGGVIVVAIDGRDEWLVHTHVPPGQTLEAFDPEPAMFAAIGEAFAYEVVSEARWTARAMVVNKYREGRVFLAGDAAHLWIPMGGFGMNSGIGDAASLGWLLAGVQQGWLDAKALDAYGIERSSLGEKVAMQAVKWGRDMGVLLRPEPAVREGLLTSAAARAEYETQVRAVNTSEWQSVGMMLGFAYTGSPLIAYDGAEPPPFVLDDYRESSAPGARAPHLWRAGRPTLSLHDQFGTGFTLLRIGADAPSGTALIEAARARGVPLTVLEVPEPEAVRKYEAFGLVLVRPDQHIAWRSRGEIVDAGDAGAILDRITGRAMSERRVQHLQATRLGGDCSFPEGLRFRRGKLVFSDMTGRRVLSLDPKTGAQTVLFDVPQQPNGLAHLPDGRLVVASMLDGKLLIAAADGLVAYADLSSHALGHLGDMVVDRAGGLFVGDVGSKVLQGEAPKPGRVVRVDADGTVRVVLEDIHFPNGMAITPDGNTLLLAETMRDRVLQIRIEADGSLGTPRPYIEFGDKGGPDGIAIERSGAIWVCLPKSRAVERYDGAGRLTARVETPDGLPIACAVGADDRTLYIVGAAFPPDQPLFQAIATGATRGWVASADLPGTTP
jgi:2-polyprenyl-6-methoxyphenol hydroxylase-like FAD-dependent oxidoreductase/sugar lactone lactonase YvrE